jgi:tRNA-dihydrouridine synthase
LIPQILGNEPEPIRQSVEKLEAWGVQGVDINMGCPVAKALKHNYGVSLMGDPHYAAEVVRMTTRVANVPVSVKLRAVESGELTDLMKFVEGLVEGGASWLTLHPRRGSQKRRGEADWSQIRWLREQIDLPVIGNGDVQTVEDVERMLDDTGCDMVMVGRALTARPWLLWQFAEKQGWQMPPEFETRQVPSHPQEEAQEYGRALQRLLSYMREDFSSEPLALRKFLFFVKTGSVWLDFGQPLVGLVHKASSIAQLQESLNEFFKQDLSMYQRTELRQ